MPFNFFLLSQSLFLFKLTFSITLRFLVLSLILLVIFDDFKHKKAVFPVLIIILIRLVLIHFFLTWTSYFSIAGSVEIFLT